MKGGNCGNKYVQLYLNGIVSYTLSFAYNLSIRFYFVVGGKIG